MCDDLTDAQVKALRLADNKVAEIAEWDYEKLELELSELAAVLEMHAFGFPEAAEVDLPTEDLEEFFTEEPFQNKEIKMIKCPHCAAEFEL